MASLRKTAPPGPPGIQFALIQRLDEAERALHRLARTDELTGLPNRWALMEAGEGMLRHPRGGRRTMALLFVDVDHFKHINDTHGHVVGDQVLRHLARRIDGGLRETDLLCRFGGEEFAALLPDTDEQTAAEVAERLRHTAAATPVRAREEEGPAIPVTLSLGLAAADAESVDDIHGLIDRADRAVYAAKDAGRDTVVPLSAIREGA
ncbi:GGDEF domain-containing protein [Arhodomonas aquaeolei]|uniref:GGDEF domain-containing protein n=1 Tax=Arhodomonas aquaeolei TaxID=2369 RepID=UPI002169C2E2|nr:GGDEF domain-containing protein [Arhodomonas aquaeolei]MCS4503421.1 GGDEF domain-containing protein [Arhodomonas aquaeolei]